MKTSFQLSKILDTHLITETAGAVSTEPHHTDWLGALTGTNNTGELTAIIQGLRWCYQHLSQATVTIRTDSKYSIDSTEVTAGVTTNYATIHLLRYFIHILRQDKQCEITLSHIRAHRGEQWNERADALAAYGKTLFPH